MHERRSGHLRCERLMLITRALHRQSSTQSTNVNGTNAAPNVCVQLIAKVNEKQTLITYISTSARHLQPLPPTNTRGH